MFYTLYRTPEHTVYGLGFASVFTCYLFLYKNNIKQNIVYTKGYDRKMTTNIINVDI